MAEGTPHAFDTVDEAIAEIAAGRLIIVTDDEDRENEGDLIMSAAKATPETVNMMIRHGRGLICVPTVETQLRRLGLGPMVQNNRESHRTDFTVSVDAAQGVTTGISAADRCAAIRVIGNPEASADDLVQPGHVFPLRARPGGVLERAGHTEAAVDVSILAGLPPAGVLCEILNEDGTMARLPELIEFRKAFGLKMISIAQLIEYRHRRDSLVERILTQPFASDYGDFSLHIFRSRLDGGMHFALSLGELTEEVTPVRVHSENILSDIFAARGMASRQHLDAALRYIAKEGHGVVLYMGQPCGGLQIPKVPGAEEGTERDLLKPVKMDFRAYGIGAQILSALGLRKIRLLSSSQRRVVALDGYGLEIVEQIDPTA